ncbi:MAG TPA: N-acetylglucosamine-6-phosphate deacetylase [Pyrinomonadaceae bacterium]|nr:N-acetylglucosamine-6-phosphate deacetylase [Chloracidobacterium sp.]MBP9935706.1 N-acetylglucosamine-6-phosphate deacetylase [Pyrinomonadaceae bacterium]MBK7802642.1 N-acetylglucosamine-6-phosphate deacetylase [Chloracidobacterium sp.]MBK9437490.1 N-acetylglucosamine-6-phosphate deacetylase [Chloracidobacterium sp.]MBL0240161.1 N-acetylglucosamine-6-phosphate deacetylase [Chloracidobacterium sp.]
MASILIKNAELSTLSTSKPASILIENGRITKISTSTLDSGVDMVIDGTGLTAFPGFIDVHIHGAVGVDINEADADDMLRVAEFLAANGITSWVPTLVPDSDANYHRVIGEIEKLCALQGGKPVAQAVGVHYEGIFANEKMCGALRPEYFKRFGDTLSIDLPRLKSGAHLTTLAPEVTGGIDLIRLLVSEGWVPLIGHTNADVATLDAAFSAGARHMTHFYNAMTGIHHRDLGVAGWALTKSDVTFDIIVDGIHVEPRMLKLAVDAKLPENVLLISDSVAPTGLGDGSFELWGENVSVTAGRTRNERGSIAGSVINMLDAFRQMSKLGYSNRELSLMSSRNPARLIGMDDQLGSLDEGKCADIVLLDADGSVRHTIVRGVALHN